MNILYIIKCPISLTANFAIITQTNKIYFMIIKIQKDTTELKTEKQNIDVNTSCYVAVFVNTKYLAKKL